MLAIKKQNMKRLTILLAALIMVVVTASAQAKQTVKVLEYCPAPGQFTNNLPEIDNTMSAEERLKACEEQLEDGNLVCLGAAGGYITVALDQPIKNGKGSDIRILGNAFYSVSDPKYGDATIGGSVEPGIVYVGVGSTPETAEWYELAGSEYYTTEMHRFEITYYKPTVETGESTTPYITIDNYIRWTASWTNPDGSKQTAEGWQPKNQFHNQSYWPAWEENDQITFRGARLPDNAINYGGDGSDPDNPQYWVSYRYAADSYGYVDAAPNSDDVYTTFDLDWAVDSDGNPKHLDHADFIRIQSGVLQQCGWTGETSTEVSSITNLHLTEGYDDNPIIITPRQRPTGIAGTSANAARETMRMSIDGRRLLKPERGINIVRYSDGSVRKVVVK